MRSTPTSVGIVSLTLNCTTISPRSAVPLDIARGCGALRLIVVAHAGVAPMTKAGRSAQVSSIQWPDSSTFRCWGSACSSDLYFSCSLLEPSSDHGSTESLLAGTRPGWKLGCGSRAGGHASAQGCTKRADRATASALSEAKLQLSEGLGICQAQPLLLSFRFSLSARQSRCSTSVFRGASDT